MFIKMLERMTAIGELWTEEREYSTGAVILLAVMALVGALQAVLGELEHSQQTIDLLMILALVFAGTKLCAGLTAVFGRFLLGRE
tara:strand:+ start:220 stop:474 length:255 start_codon:yes stop_codon:yes gene_type:complete